MLCAIMFFQKIVSFMYLDELKKKKIMQKRLYSYNRRTGLASECWVSISDLTFFQGDNY